MEMALLSIKTDAPEIDFLQNGLLKPELNRSHLKNKILVQIQHQDR